MRMGCRFCWCSLLSDRDMSTGRCARRSTWLARRQAEQFQCSCSENLQTPSEEFTRQHRNCTNPGASVVCGRGRENPYLSRKFEPDRCQSDTPHNDRHTDWSDGRNCSSKEQATTNSWYILPDVPRDLRNDTGHLDSAKTRCI